MRKKDEDETKKDTYAVKINEVFTKIVFWLLAVISVVFLVIMGVLMVQKNNSDLEQKVTDLGDDIDSYMSEKKTAISTLAATVATNTVEGYENQLALVDEIAAMDSMVAAVYICYPDESLVYSGGWQPDPGFVLTDRVWYVGAKNTEEVFITEPYVDETTGGFCITLSKQVKSGGKLQCVVGMDLYLDNIVTLVSDTFQSSSYSFLTSAEGVILAHPDKDLILSADKQETLETAINGHYAKLIDAKNNKVVSDYKGGIKIMMPKNLDCGWKVVAAVPLKNILVPLVILLFVNLCIFVCAVMMSKRMCRVAVTKWFDPLVSISQKMNEIAEGNLEIHFDEEPITEEIQTLTTSLNTTIEQLNYYIGDISHVVRNIAEGNLDVQKHVEYKGSFVEIDKAMEHILDTLNEMISQVAENAGCVADYSVQVQDSTEQLAQGANSQNEEVSLLVENIQKLSEKINMILENVQNASTISDETNEQLHNGNGKMHELVQAMERINESSEKIEEITATINALAAQTSLLSLNASIEAARAGEAGRGFAVVADEIGKLSNASTEASGHITELIQNSKQAVEKGKKIVEEAARMITISVENSQKLDEEIQEITGYVGEQNTALDQISKGAAGIADVIETNAAASEENTAISGELMGQADILQKSVQQFKLRKK